MGLISKLSDDATTLENLNLVQHGEYQQEGKLLIMSTTDSKNAFVKNETLNEVMVKASEDKAKILASANKTFSELDEFKTKKNETGFGTTRPSSSSSTSSTSSTSGWSSGSSRFSSNSDNVEDRVSKMMKKAMDIADEEVEIIGTRGRRRRKKSLFDKLIPKKSKRRKVMVIIGIIAAESLMTILVMAQQTAKATLKERRSKR